MVLCSSQIERDVTDNLIGLLPKGFLATPCLKINSYLKFHLDIGLFNAMFKSRLFFGEGSSD